MTTPGLILISHIPQLNKKFRCQVLSILLILHNTPNYCIYIRNIRFVYFLQTRFVTLLHTAHTPVKFPIIHTATSPSSHSAQTHSILLKSSDLLNSLLKLPSIIIYDFKFIFYGDFLIFYQNTMINHQIHSTKTQKAANNSMSAAFNCLFIILL